MKVIDLFAGAGGFSEGASQAGAQVIWAGNHWGKAVETHSMNHPEAHHVCQDLHQADWTQVPKHDLLLASPACQGHSKAKGKEKSYHDALRATAWAVVSALECHQTPFALIENVPEMLDWELYPAWEHALKLMGYNIEPFIFNSADFGVPQNRLRLFIMLSRSKPIGLVHPGEAHVPASEIINTNEDQNKWSDINKKGRAQATLEKIARSRQRFGSKFLLAYYGNEKYGRSLDKTLGTITTRDTFAVVSGDQMRMLTVDEQRVAMGFPAEYILAKTKADSVKMLGNAVCPPVAKNLIQQIMNAA